jgi:hypothetical protein
MFAYDSRMGTIRWRSWLHATAEQIADHLAQLLARAEDELLQLERIPASVLTFENFVLGIDRFTVEFSNSLNCLRHLESPWMLGAAQGGFSRLIIRINARTSFGTVGRPCLAATTPC